MKTDKDPSQVLVCELQHTIKDLQNKLKQSDKPHNFFKLEWKQQWDKRSALETNGSGTAPPKKMQSTT